MNSFFRLLSPLLLSAALLSACNSKPSSEQTATVASPEVQPAPARPVVATDAALTAQLQNPQVGDVYVVQFQPRNTTEQRYYFYQVFAVRPNEIDLHPAKKEVAGPQADSNAPDFYSTDKMTYTRAEALELLQEQPGDVLHSRLIAVQRP
ncbi:hypothetical protein SAMN06265337_1893 [Hymenobacter gelipurpurascens]|uniref:Lipoprotein n=1 Tax=Hymenobacter gelipurpurascens TaxID=89968 RepID=A0A212TMI6_9BACT|nr:hypothetical protein [Hymenobacter gelipurpurascens]SNC67267.1 hypothetical protein SAMN06265337_1893 [Hymenobacter gelipurpurascens]